MHMQMICAWCTFPIDISALDKSISILEAAISMAESRSAWWERLLWICTGAVVIGVTFDLWVVIKEYRDERKDWLRAAIHSPEKPSASFFVFELIAIFLITIGVLGELVIGVVSGNINTELRHKNNSLIGLIQQKAGAAEMDASCAIDRATAAAQQVAGLEKESESLRHQNLLLQEKLAPRRLSASQRAKIATKLVSCAGEQMEMILLRDAPDIEGLATDISNAVSGKNGAGWVKPSINTFASDPYRRNVSGLLVETKTEVGPNSATCAKLLAEALRSERLDVSGPSLRPTNGGLFIGGTIGGIDRAPIIVTIGRKP
jgi:hypothetical protein